MPAVYTSYYYRRVAAGPLPKGNQHFKAPGGTFTPEAITIQLPGEAKEFLFAGLLGALVIGTWSWIALFIGYAAAYPIDWQDILLFSSVLLFIAPTAAITGRSYWTQSRGQKKVKTWLTFERESRQIKIFRKKKLVDTIEWETAKGYIDILSHAQRSSVEGILIIEHTERGKQEIQRTELISSSRLTELYAIWHCLCAFMNPNSVCLLPEHEKDLFGFTSQLPPASAYRPLVQNLVWKAGFHSNTFQ
ncbi:hypothetical protein CAI21_18875 [Alkalilimnicola ehrlichii]|uniref:Uncharacterized protein n=1 Tax=Alkalilimnicola ehrlichii TaxID=351052 RepID=A0A3E0WKU3_9GAMM|nr:hypothetical protein [Alkalilimnicola ehrlichii]RFA25588.1 hypothetical protein CAI21_18875 [Alkalilimnicola ehrlichii]RFA32717.1 hypothetical protein CAL65_19140 [Alkalilimnicola ehrlichii]